ncbi:MAG: hypothetical protein CSA53_06420 [Gammaproteobacteria bacterium]|nr:MAG: hypothetical protein CSA53_06420 [Gammaproteobacteria bacterium]
MGVFPVVNESVTATEVLPKVALSYAFSPWVNAYVSASKGWQPGGINDDAFLTEEDKARGLFYTPETLWNYEIGFKNVNFDETLSWHISAFYSRAKDWHEMSFLRDEETGEAASTSVIINAAELESQGAELELTWRATTNLTLSSGLGYTDSEYKEFKLMYLDLDNKRVQDAVDVLDASLEWEVSPFTVTLFAENIFDKYYFNGQAFSDFVLPVEGVYFSSPAPPRRVGIALSVAL